MTTRSSAGFTAAVRRAVRTRARPLRVPGTQRERRGPSRCTGGLVALMMIVLDVRCGADPKAPVGSLRLIQATGRGGEADDNLGALLVGQAVCGTHVFVRSEGGKFSQLGGARVEQACIPLGRARDVRDFELSIYPVHTAAHVHAQLFLDPSACPMQDSCAELCDLAKVPEQPDEIDPDSGTCPASWVALDQVTLLVGNVLPAAPETTTGATSDTTSAAHMTGTTAGPDPTSSASATDGTTTTTGTSTNTSTGTSAGSTT